MISAGYGIDIVPTWHTHWGHLSCEERNVLDAIRDLEEASQDSEQLSCIFQAAYDTLPRVLKDAYDEAFNYLAP
jgi:hypothetical protein